MASSFAHLHLHSQYSLLDGAIRLKDLFPRLRALGMDSVALTDHGNMFGALDFYKAAKQEGIKPIFGCEIYVSDGAMTDRTSRKAYHFVLLAKDQAGYANLSYLVSKGYLEGFYYTPRIDKALLKKHSQGLIGLSACLGGEVAQGLLTKGRTRAEEIATAYKDAFEPGSFFLEVQPNGLSEQDEVNDALRKMAAKLKLPLVATNDCHYLERKDAYAHDCLMCVQTGKLVSDTDRIKHDVDEYYLKSPEEMATAFASLPEAVENAARIAELCRVDLNLGETHLPRYQVPAGHSLEQYLAKLANEGLQRRFDEMRQLKRTVDEKAYRDRLAHELAVIQSMGFSSYFLIVWDFIRFAKGARVPVGPGRGSGAGSLVAYALRITDVDPIYHRLLFERFLNPERVSMPDFDIDFCMHRRDEVIRYVVDKYGRDNVGQIVTMHQLKARGVTRDVARVMGLSYAEGDRIAKLIPEPIQGRSVSVPQALEQEPRLRELAKENPRVAEVLDVAASLEGLNRHAGTHAAGVVIGDRPLWEYVPCFRGQNGELVTQFAKNEVEEAGLVKFDFLGLKTLTILDHAIRLIARGGTTLALEGLPTDDVATYEMMSSGQTTGVFQCESSGFKDLLKKLKPDCFEDIVAAVALYRPGPLEGGMVDDFIKRKHGQTKADYLHPWLEPILRDTYGVIVYQEQVMQIASALAGYSMGQADMLRRAMGKKKPKEMAEQKEVFLLGAAKKKVDRRIAEQVFELMAFFAGYGFNRSHSVAYALISYYTAYLKQHFPAEFMAAVLSCEKDDIDTVTKYITETRSMGIEVTAPDVNSSESLFAVVESDGGKRIPFGLSAVRHVGEGAVDAILAAREDGPFTDLYEFCGRVDMRRVNKRVVEALIKSGAFDGVAPPPPPQRNGESNGVNRAQLLAALEAAFERAQSAQRDRESGQTNLFGLIETDAPTSGPQANGSADGGFYPDLPDWPPKQRLAFERESLGFYVSGHPLDRYQEDLRRHADTAIADLGDRAPHSDVRVGGLVGNYRERPLRSGKGRMALFTLEDQQGGVEVVVFSRPFEEFEATLKADEPILVTGRVVFEGEGEATVPRIHLKSVTTLADVRLQKTSQVCLRFHADRLSDDEIATLKQILREHVGDCATQIELSLPNRSRTVLRLSERYSVNPTDEFLLKVETQFGKQVAVLR